jgi:hypothetical protein
MTRLPFIQTPNRFAETVELAVLNMADQLDAKNALIMLNSMGTEGSTELIECLDRIIGSKIDELNAKQLYSALIGFKTV